MASNKILRVSKKRPLIFLVGALVLFSVAFAWSKAFRSEEAIKTNHATAEVMRGPLRISVIASGSIKAKEQIVIKNEVEGRTSIIYLVPEGTRVQKGDLLVELDASRLLDEKVDQQIKVQNMEAAFVSARENSAVVENQAQADVDKARLAYDFAKEDLKKYLEGEYPNQLKDWESRITLAKEELTRAEEKVDWSKKLYDEKYISESELAADELTMKRKALDLELAKSNLDLLINFTHKRKLAQLESDVKQAEMALERTVRKAKADVVQAKANLEAKKAEFDQQKDKLKKNETQIGKAKIYAPAEGLVIHATSAQSGGGPGRRTIQPLDEGQEVRERQELIHLPVSSAAKVEVAIPEASLDKVRIGLPVRVTVDAIPGETFLGKVAKIAPLPDAQSAWLNPDLKVYNTDIYLENNNSALRTGMSCKVEIIVEQYMEATYIPVQAVLRVGVQPTVYVVREGKLEPRKVEIGLDNNRVVRIIKGLEPGELVSLTPPLAAAAVEPAEYSKDITTDMIPAKTEEKPAPGVRRETTEKRPTEGQAGPGVDRKAAQGEGAPMAGGPAAGGAGGLSPEQQQAQRERLQNLPPEEQERRRQFFESLPPEERERLRTMSAEERRKFVQERMGSAK
ncbi:MAG: efflux RND transporter periplasmic adaptor subunit [Proteobacteria bacterium]|nr:efflux RND transporter periplasmic adaptor subunit [Pseudomonadota bacterium]